VGFVGLEVIWSVYGHRNSYNEEFHMLRSIRRGVSSHWHCTDTMIVSHWRFSFRHLGTNAYPHPYHSLLFLGLLAVSDWLLAALLPDSLTIAVTELMREQ
jgi:hypothetical protein